MRIAVASGKGGTGKTTVATNLAWIASKSGLSVGFVDCDVEEPNGALFLKPHIVHTKIATVSVPKLNPEMCDACGLCGDLCQYSAIVVVDHKVLTFPDLCHGCAGCWRVCPTGALVESSRQIGRISIGVAGNIHFVDGELNIGEALSPPVIEQTKKSALPSDLLIFDAPPGTGCPVVETVKDVDYVLLVTEPTPFGLHDLKLAVETVRAIRVPFGVVINRAGTGNQQTDKYCMEQKIPILASIPDDRRIAEISSQGTLISEAIPELRPIFKKLLERISSVC